MESTLTLIANKKAELQTKAKELQAYVDQLTAVQQELALIKQLEKAVSKTEVVEPAAASDMKAFGKQAAAKHADLEELVAQYKANYRR